MTTISPPATHRKVIRNDSEGTLVLFLRKASKFNWQCYIKLRNNARSIRFSTGEPDFWQASKIASERFTKVIANRCNADVPFHKLADEWWEYIANEIKLGVKPAHYVNYKSHVQRFLKGFFGEKPVGAIDDRAIEDYTEWRRAYWITGIGKDIEYISYERNGKIVKCPASSYKKVPSDKMLNEEMMLLKQMLAFAVRKGWFNEASIPLITKKKHKTNRRPTFTDIEVRHLLQFMDKWVAEPVQQAIHTEYRHLCRSYVIIMLNSGTRPAELHDTCWRDVELQYIDNDGNQQVRLAVDGKTGKRQLIALPAARAGFQQLWDRFILNHQREPSPDDRVFMLPDGSVMRNFRSSFEKLLIAAALTHNIHKEPYSLYSCRHYYATMQLKKSINIHTLAINLGTSTEMIENHYSHLTPSMAARELTAA